MRPDLTEDEQLENERIRSSVRPTRATVAPPDRTAPNLDDDLYRRFGSTQPDDMDYRDYSADQEWVCERCGADLPPNAKFCASCGYGTTYSTRATRINRLAEGLNRWFSADGEMNRRFGLTTASMVALAVALFCVIIAIAVQLTVPENSPAYSPADLYQVYGIRTLLWLMGGVVALVAAMVFKRAPRSY
ncbi:MAG TPA: zinc ribbon domain-containing protein [Blastocatellia bacterium]|nr:zinc ribbon domain-containing protein [Blastocatellia bacterium]